MSGGYRELLPGVIDEPLPFPDRHGAGLRLSKYLTAYQGALVLAIPRGGVEVAAPVASKLKGQLDVLLTRKVSAPHDPELALGAVAPGGLLLLNESLLRAFNLTAADLAPQVDLARRELERRLRLYRGNRPWLNIGGREVIVVDDGIATGFTLKAGIAWLRKQKPSLLVLATPVAPPNVWLELSELADRGVCLATPEPFYAVGQFYEDFSPTDEETILTMLQESWAGREGNP